MVNTEKAINLLNQAISLLENVEAEAATASKVEEDRKLLTRWDLLERLPGITSETGLVKRLERANITPVARKKPKGWRRGPGRFLYTEDQLELLLEDAKTIGKLESSNEYEIVYL